LKGRLKHRLYKSLGSISDRFLYIMIVVFIVVAIVFIYLSGITLWIRIPMIATLLFSLYYQVAALYYNVHGTLFMKIEDRAINELYYQVIKRGYNITFGYDGDKLTVKDHNVPKWKKKWINFISFIHVILRPAWWYRDVDEQEAIEA